MAGMADPKSSGILQNSAVLKKTLGECPQPQSSAPPDTCVSTHALHSFAKAAYTQSHSAAWLQLSAWALGGTSCLFPMFVFLPVVLLISQKPRVITESIFSLLLRLLTNLLSLPIHTFDSNPFPKVFSHSFQFHSIPDHGIMLYKAPCSPSQTRSHVPILTKALPLGRRISIKAFAWRLRHLMI